MTLPTWAADEVLNASKLDDYTDHLQGASGSTEAWHFRVTVANDLLITLPEAAGAQGVRINDSDNDQIFKVDSNGVVTATPSDVIWNTTAGLLKHEAGGIEADISAVVVDDLIIGSATGAMALGRGMILHGEDAGAESTTTSTGDLKTLSSLSIATTKKVRVEFDFRKGSGAAVVVFGLKLNSTEVMSTTAGFDISATATNEAQSGHAVIEFGPRDDAAYLRNMTGTMSVAGSAGEDAQSLGSGAAQPSATITQVIVTVQTNASSLTAGVKNLRVYTLN